MDTHSDKDMSTCNYCDSKISVLTRKLQSKPDASLFWWKHGVCSASCSSTVKINQAISLIKDGDPKHPPVLDGPVDFEILTGNSEMDFSAEEVYAMKICRRRKIACQAVLITGNIMQLSGVVGGILLLYSNKPINALFGLGSLILGVLLIRMSKFFSLKLLKTMAALRDRD